MKNLIIRESKYGRVVSFLEGQGDRIDEYKYLEYDGYIVEATDEHYTKKWNRWWIA